LEDDIENINQYYKDRNSFNLNNEDEIKFGGNSEIEGINGKKDNKDCCK